MSSSLPSTLMPVKQRFATWRAVSAMIFREMSTTYGRSPGGYLWAVLEPAAGIGLLSLIFSLAFRTPPLGVSFALFYASGMLVFLMFVDISGKISQAVQFSKQLLEYPRVTFMDAILARLILNTITHLAISFLVVGFIFIFFKTNTTIDIQKITLAYCMAIFLSLGFGTINGYLILLFPMWRNIWGILMRPMVIISGIIFLFDSVPQPYSDFLWYNPIIHIVGMMRDGYYPFYQPTYVSQVYVYSISCTLTLIGIFLKRRYYKDLLLK